MFSREVALVAIGISWAQGQALRSNWGPLRWDNCGAWKVSMGASHRCLIGAYNLYLRSVRALLSTPNSLNFRTHIGQLLLEALFGLCEQPWSPQFLFFGQRLETHAKMPSGQRATAWIWRCIVAQGQWPEFKFLHTKLYTI